MGVFKNEEKCQKYEKNHVNGLRNSHNIIIASIFWSHDYIIICCFNKEFYLFLKIRFVYGKKGWVGNPFGPYLYIWITSWRRRVEIASDWIEPRAAAQQITWPTEKRHSTHHVSDRQRHKHPSRDRPIVRHKHQWRKSYNPTQNQPQPTLKRHKTTINTDTNTTQKQRQHHGLAIVV